MSADDFKGTITMRAGRVLRIRKVQAVNGSIHGVVLQVQGLTRDS